MAQLSAALDASEKASEEQRVKIVNLGQRLNAALASKVEELTRFRSEFFGRLRDILGNQKGIRIVGDRFVFQSEVLFDVGSADLGAAGQAQIAQIATTLLDISKRIPKDIDWVLQVEGHTDKTPIATARFPSNWELSTARAIAVVHDLIADGLPPERLAATGYGEFKPIETGTDPESLRRNRRIELKLTQR
jgi:chemotaxis protein MotB